MDQDTITIVIKDYKNNNQTKTVTLIGVEFIRRFLMHILPKGFVKIRYFGILVSRNKKTKLTLCRKLAHSPLYKPKFEGLKTIDILCILVGKDVTLCPLCKKGKLLGVSTLLPEALP
ncbi:Putative transposase [Clostridium formicaceticum]|uniref:Transposase n=1 Tax=Clostridium formicaceticum TaxID=1497 RepID=A0AAC9RJF2_9CLOT|nr:Putative transposase [Clostridium formicaceticum]